MKSKSVATALGGLVLVMTLAACQPSAPAPDAGSNVPFGIDKIAGKAIAEAKQEIANENLSLDKGDGGKPKAEITPQGDLLIDGKQVEVNAEQKALLVAYRTELTAVASAGMDIGLQGASMGLSAAAAAIKGVASGQDEQEIDKAVEAEAKAKILPHVQKLCARLPVLLKTQDALAATLPAFKPYANMDQSDVDDCAKDLQVEHGA